MAVTGPSLPAAISRSAVPRGAGLLVWDMAAAF